VVTGGAGGMGRGAALKLAAEGAAVEILDRQDARAVCEEIRQAGGTANSQECDTTDEAALARCAAAIEGRHGRIDILVNNAGIQFTAPIEEFPPEKWDAIIAVNLSAAFHAIHAALPQMKARKWGRIINVASTHGLVASAHKVAYVAAKHGIVGLTKVVGIECADTGVTCNAICPGWVLTPLVQAQIEARAKAGGISVETASRALLAEKQPQLQFTKPEQIAALALFLASDAASNMQGAQLVSDGGWTAQ
jgi:3-hydroxybutyrate dehydrogenase